MTHQGTLIGNHRPAESLEGGKIVEAWRREFAVRAGKPAGVCGEAAADPELACVLVGLGITSLSAHPSALPHIGANLALVNTTACRQAATAALAAPDPAAARAAARNALAEADRVP